MVRTRDTAGLKVGAKAPRKGLSGPSTSSLAASTSSSGKKARVEDGGGNPVCPRETPAWQKPITDFFRQSSSKIDDKMEDDAGNALSNGAVCEDADGSSKGNVKPEEENVPSISNEEGKMDKMEDDAGNALSNGAVCEDADGSSKGNVKPEEENVPSISNEEGKESIEIKAGKSNETN